MNKNIKFGRILLLIILVILQIVNIVMGNKSKKVKNLIALTPEQMQKKMNIGINLGNLLELPKINEIDINKIESYLIEFKEKGFRNVRIPIRWGNYLQNEFPYKVDKEFLKKITKIIDISINLNLVTVINSQHDDWFKLGFEKEIPRFMSLWEQISKNFSNKSREYLLFEIYNEPNSEIFTLGELNSLNLEILKIIRETGGLNDKRIVFFGGLDNMNPYWILENPNSLIFPKDEYIMLEIHSYDPFNYAKIDPTSFFWGSNDDIARMEEWMNNIEKWSDEKDIKIYLGEFGVTKQQTLMTGRYEWYKEYIRYIKKLGWCASLWNDDGRYEIFDRDNVKWDNKILKILDFE